MSTYLYYSNVKESNVKESNVKENDKICFSYVPSVGSVRYKVNNDNGKINVEPGVKITQNNINNINNINDEKNMVSNSGMYYKEPEVNGSTQLLILLKKLREPPITLGQDYQDILVWLIQYIENNLDDSQIDEKYNKSKVKEIVNNAIQNINSIKNDSEKKILAFKILTNIEYSKNTNGGFNITRRLFGKRNDSSKRRYRSNKRYGYNRKHGSNRRYGTTRRRIQRR
jgi:hypothetical protein